MPASERRLAAIMFTDIVGYTKMSQAKESLALELLEEHRSIVRPLVASHGGTEVKTIGDAFLVEFKSALDAVLCAAEIQQRMEARNSGAQSERRMQARIGVHLGDVVHESGDVYGDAVNVASRIEPLAEPGGLCITQQVFESVRNKTDLQIEKMGDVGLKNVELPMAVYRVNLKSAGTERDQVAPRERLAVLPFVNISPDPNDEYFADGLTEELISKLSEVKGLKVIARTSVMNYKKKEKSVSQIGRELEAGSIIEGSVRKAGNKIRVTVQLIDARTEEHLWASNYDKQLDDIFAIQSDVAGRVANSVASGFLSRPKGADTADVEAYTLYIKAAQLYHDGTEPELREALKLLNHAIARDPNFARAHAQVADVYCQMAVRGYEDYPVISAMATPAAKKALEIDPECVEGHVAMSKIHSLLDRFDESVSEAETAIRLNPNSAEAYLELGINNGSLGRMDTAYEYCLKAFEIDPLNAHCGGILGRVAMAAGRVDVLLHLAERLQTVTPKNPWVFINFAEYHMLRGELAEAQTWLDKGKVIAPKEAVLLVDQGLLYTMAGKRPEALSTLALLQENKAESVRTYGKLFIYAALGEFDTAFEALMKSAELHTWPFLIGTLPVFAELRKDPRYKVFAEKVGIPA